MVPVVAPDHRQTLIRHLAAPRGPHDINREPNPVTHREIVGGSLVAVVGRHPIGAWRDLGHASMREESSSNSHRSENDRSGEHDVIVLANDRSVMPHESGDRYNESAAIGAPAPNP